MFLYIPAIFQSVIFAVILEVLAFYKEFFWAYSFLFILVSVIGFRVVVKKWSFWYLAIIFLLSVWSIVHLIDYELEKHVFIGLSSVVYYFMLLGIYRKEKNIRDETARSLISMVLMAAIFLFFSASYGIYLNFEVHSWWLMIFYFLNISAVSYQYFAVIERRKRGKVLVYSLILGFATLEMGWIANFWPFGYLTTGFILLVFYYVLWDLIQSYFLKRLSRKRVFADLVFFIVVSGIVLYSSRWTPMI